MASDNMAWENSTQFEQLADSLTGLADQLHRRVMRAIKQRAAAPNAALSITLVQAQALFEDEVALRQRANLLYAYAAREAGADLALAMGSVLAATGSAQLTMRRINVFKELIDLSTDLLALASAAVAGKPEQMISAAEKINRDVNSLRRQAAPPLA